MEKRLVGIWSCQRLLLLSNYICQLIQDIEIFLLLKLLLCLYNFLQLDLWKPLFKHGKAFILLYLFLLLLHFLLLFLLLLFENYSQSFLILLNFGLIQRYQMFRFISLGANSTFFHFFKHFESLFAENTATTPVYEKFVNSVKGYRHYRTTEGEICICLTLSKVNCLNILKLSNIPKLLRQTLCHKTLNNSIPIIESP